MMSPRATSPSVTTPSVSIANRRPSGESANTSGGGPDFQRKRDVGSCLPPNGPVQMLVLSKVQVFDGAKNVIARYDELPLVPNNLVGFKITEGPL